MLVVELNLRKPSRENSKMGMCTQISADFAGLDRTVVSIMHCGCIDPGSIPGLDIFAHGSNFLRTTLF